MFSSYVSQVIRLYTGTNHIEMEFTVGPIPLKYVLASSRILLKSLLFWLSNSMTEYFIYCDFYCIMEVCTFSQKISSQNQPHNIFMVP